jgi:hypothetical protein
MNSHFKNPNLNWFRLLVLAGAAAVLCSRTEAQTIVLGTAADFAVLGGATITNTGLTVISGTIGGIGTNPGTSVTGFPPGVVTGGSIHANDAAAIQAKVDATTAYNQLAGLAFTTTLTGQDLAGLTLQPGVFNYSAAAAFTTGVLTLDGQNQANPLFVFQIGTTLISTGAVSFNFINGATTNNLWFQVGSSATLGSGASFAGTIIASASDTLNTGASLNGRVFALNGAATLDTNQITGVSAIPEPASVALVISGLVSLGAMAVRGFARRKTVKASESA